MWLLEIIKNIKKIAHIFPLKSLSPKLEKLKIEKNINILAHKICYVDDLLREKPSFKCFPLTIQVHKIHCSNEICIKYIAEKHLYYIIEYCLLFTVLFKDVMNIAYYQ
jgi:hypothetical protein